MTLTECEPDWVAAMYAAGHPERSCDQVWPGLWVGGCFYGPPEPGEFHTVFTLVPMYEDPQRVPRGTRHVRVPFRDRSDLPIDTDLLAGVVGRVVSEVRAGRRVLVRCYMGINRAPMVAALALAELTGCSGRQAIAAVRAERSPSLFNTAFLELIEAVPAKGDRDA